VAGDRASGAHGTFGLFKAGGASPNHVHSGAYHGVVIKGVMIDPFGNETNSPRLGPGSYWCVPASAKHVTACVSKEPCLFDFYADTAVDFTPVK
jgi:quercetin dioxygenase-like cupin family protein